MVNRHYHNEKGVIIAVNDEQHKGLTRTGKVTSDTLLAFFAIVVMLCVFGILGAAMIQGYRSRIEQEKIITEQMAQLEREEQERQRIATERREREEQERRRVAEEQRLREQRITAERREQEERERQERLAVERAERERILAAEQERQRIAEQQRLAAAARAKQEKRQAFIKIYDSILVGSHPESSVINALDTIVGGHRVWSDSESTMGRRRGIEWKLDGMEISIQSLNGTVTFKSKEGF